MATFIILGNFTEQGIKTFRDSPDRSEAIDGLLRQQGGSLTSIHWTMGQYDFVAVADAPDAESAMAVLLLAGAQGNVRTTTLQAFDHERFKGIIRRTG